MPFGDGTGPLGLGPMTGRGLGYCAGHNHPGYVIPGFGWGRGWGLGRALGWYLARAWRYPRFYPFTPKEEKEILINELKALKEEIKAIEERLKELEKKRG